MNKAPALIMPGLYIVTRNYLFNNIIHPITF